MLDWQNSSGGKSEPFDTWDNITPMKLGQKINKISKGQLKYIYMTHDAGTRLAQFYELADVLDSHVRIVNHDQLVQLALKKEGIPIF